MKKGSKIAVIVCCAILVIAITLGVFVLPHVPMGKSIDLNKFTITFEEDFKGELDRSVWSGHYQYGEKTEARKGSFWNQYMAYTENGSLVIPVKYLEQGMGEEGAGWYSAGIDTDDDAPNGFSQKYGYFECRCILPKGADIWSAFWLMNDGVYNEDGSGEDGTEIDIFESDCYGDFLPNSVTSNLHIDGYGDAHKRLGAQKYLTGNNPYEEFNTYGLEWNEKEYIFYINGRETFRTDFGGVSKNEEYLILSVEMKGENGTPSQRENVKGAEAEFVVDYVRVYQYNDLMSE